MADYNISAEITANTKGYEAGIKKAQTASEKLSKSIGNLTKGVGKGGLGGSLLSAVPTIGKIILALGIAKKAFEKVSKVVAECSEAYRIQNKAEIALTTSIDNNPLVDGTATTRLKSFASEMQKVSDIGDEQLLPMMADLIAKGRTETETMQIIKVATDMASTGTISFENAVSQLNATLNGNIGRLGQQNAELKTLTEEELKSGKAVEILGQKYNGLAQATADSNKQLKNAIGDLKENLGAVFEKGLDPMRSYFAEVIGNINQAISSSREFKQAMKDVFEESGEVNLTQTSDKLKTALDATINAFAEANMNYKQYLELYGAYIDEETDATAIAYRNDIAQLKEQARQISDELLRRQKESQTQTQARKDAEEQAKKEKEIADLKDEYLKKIAMQEAKWEHIKEVTGEAVGNEEKIKFYQDSLVDLMTQAQGKITTSNQLYKDQVKIIEQLQAGLQPEEKKTGNDWEQKLREQLIARLEADKEEKLAEVENSKMASWQKEQVEVNYNEQIKALKLEALAEEEREALKSVEDLANAEEEKSRIRKYYENERMDLIVSYAKENKKAGEISAQSFADGFKSVIKKLQPILKEIGKVLSSIGNIAKSMFQGGVSIFSKLFNIDLDTVLDTILKIEDKVLSFFVETLPKLPQFVASVMQSISVMLQSVLSVITPEKIAEVITNIMTVIQEQAPAIIEAIGEILSNLLEGLVASAPKMFETLNIIIDKLTEVLPSLIEKITEGIVSLMPSIMETLANVVEGIAEIIPQLVQSLIDVVIAILKKPEELARIVVAIIKGFVEIVNVLLKNIGPILEALLPAIGKIIIEIIKAIPDILASMAEALWEAVKGIGKFIVNMIIDILNLMFDGISKAWTWIPGAKGIPHIPKLATGTDNAQRGIALVGEAGPELVRFNGGEQVLNNRNTQKALAGIGNSGNTFNVTFNNTQDTTAYAMMSQLRQYNRVMAINGVI